MKNKNNREVSGIDESFLLQSIKEQDAPKQQPETPKPQDISETSEVAEPMQEKNVEPKRKRKANADYTSVFLQKNEFKTRQCVYISQRVHAAISEIIRVMGNEIAVGGYIDSILMEHLETHKEEITELYNRELSKRNNKSPIEF